MNIRAMTFNIQHAVDFINGDVAPELIANTIRAFDPDFCVLNEVYGQGDGSQPPEYGDQAKIIAELAKMDYHCFCPAITVYGKPYGNAIISKRPILSCKNIPIPEPIPHGYPGAYYENRCVFSADLGSFVVMGTHFGLAPDEQTSAVETVLSQLKETDKPVILCGDLNLTPDAPVLAPVFAALQDTASKLSGSPLSFPSDKPKIKIDYIFVSSEFRVTSAFIPPVIASDHLPYVSDLVLD